MQNPNNVHVDRLLAKLLNSLEAKVPEQAASLKPGLSQNEIDEIVKDLPFPIPPEIQQLYRWRNGGSFAIRGAGLVDVAHFYPLEESVNHLSRQLKEEQEIYSLILFSGYSQEGHDYFSIPLNWSDFPIVYLFYGYGNYFSDITEETIEARKAYPSFRHILHALTEIAGRAIRKYSESDDAILVDLELMEKISKKYKDKTLFFRD